MKTITLNDIQCVSQTVSYDVMALLSAVYIRDTPFDLTLEEDTVFVIVNCDTCLCDGVWSGGW